MKIAKFELIATLGLVVVAACAPAVEETERSASGPASTSVRQNVASQPGYDWSAVCRRARFVTEDADWSGASWTAVCQTSQPIAGVRPGEWSENDNSWHDVTWNTCRSEGATAKDITWGALCQSVSPGPFIWHDSTWDSVCHGGRASPLDTNWHSVCVPQ
jgi:hypothetical protein